MTTIILIMSVGIGALLLILFGFVAYLSFKRIQQNREEEKVAHYMETYAKDWEDFLINGSNDGQFLVPKTKVAHRAVEKLLLTYKQNIYSENTEDAIYLFADKHLQDRYRKLLYSSKWSERVNTLYRIMDFRMESLLPDIRALLVSERALSRVEIVQMYKLLAFFEQEDVIGLMNDPEVPLHEHDIHGIIYVMNEELVQKCIQAKTDLTRPFTLALLDMVGQRRNTDYLFFLESYLESTDLEIRIRALKALYTIGFIYNKQIIIDSANSDHWEERLMAAKLIRIAGDDTFLPILRKLMEDTSWHVRREAAVTISKQQGGRDILEGIISSSKDPFAVDMATEMVERGSAS
ncbi:HEAT repeat domain-containing protein [Paenalkalicoccus suaedae]|uniref:HEAT repeat domain-containing protein n=1 Tax=Paenalkalicoccus suaedae TaxID=2592382 RepID=A0A859FJM4_9BACI|nr:HEAT repeat domain-containing protein [Paenalkalicoccus suaedae]QKS72986.1 HEAT repeat domain-containing protein [Paenalkalicoccus suaedae]